MIMYVVGALLIINVIQQAIIVEKLNEIIDFIEDDYE